MRKEEKVFVGLVIAGGLLLILNAVFRQYDWWPMVFKELDTMTRGTTLGIIGVVFGILGYTMTGQMRADSNVIVSENQRWSWNSQKDKPKVAGVWRVIPIGGINSWGVSMEGEDGVVVCHKDAFEEHGGNARLIAVTRPMEKSELPPEAVLVVRKYNLRGPFFLGVAPGFVETRAKDYTKNYRQMISNNVEKDTAMTTGQKTIKALAVKNNVLATAMEREGMPTHKKLLHKILYGDGGKDGGDADNTRSD